MSRCGIGRTTEVSNGETPLLLAGTKIHFAALQALVSKRLGERFFSNGWKAAKLRN
ncbi:hypothetical protein J2W92_005922 [Rhizobium leguminosarum]